MAIPDFQSIMLPVLKFAGDGKEHSLRETIEALAEEFALTNDERNELLPSGQQATFDNRIGWARTFLQKAGLLEATRRGYYRLTQRGQQVLDQNPQRITTAFLKQFPEFVEFQTPKRHKTETAAAIETTDEDQTPEETIEGAYHRIRQNLSADLHQTIKALSPAFLRDCH
jgi:restriction system protein